MGGRRLVPVWTALLFAGSFAAARPVTLALEPLTITLLRYLIALAFLLALAARRPPGARRVARRHWPQLALMGALGIVGYHFFFFLSLRFTTLAHSALINALSPVVTALAAAALLGERLRARQYAGVGLALAGALWLLARGDAARLGSLTLNVGELLMLLAVACWTGYALLVKRLSAHYDGVALTVHATLWGVLWLAGLVWLEDPLPQLRGLGAADWAALAYMGALASGLGYLLYNDSVRALGPTRTASAVYSLVPVFVAALGWALFGEPLVWPLVAGLALVLAGLRQTLAEG